MKTLVLSIGLCILFSQSMMAQTRLVDYPSLEQIIKTKRGDTMLVVNFWATWCKPCVEELPYFKALKDKYDNKPINFIIVSCDSKKSLPAVNQFLTKKNFDFISYLITETNPNNWIDKVDKNWSGALPATWIINPNKKVNDFFEKEFTQTDLDSLIKSYGF